jgi:hypothetical protein
MLDAGGLNARDPASEGARRCLRWPGRYPRSWPARDPWREGGSEARQDHHSRRLRSACPAASEEMGRRAAQSARQERRPDRRRVEIGPRLLSVLRDMRAMQAEHRAEDDGRKLIFPGRSGGHLPRSHVSQSWHRDALPGKSRTRPSTLSGVWSCRPYCPYAGIFPRALTIWTHMARRLVSRWYHAGQLRRRLSRAIGPRGELSVGSVLLVQPDQFVEPRQEQLENRRGVGLAVSDRYIDHRCVAFERTADDGRRVELPWMIGPVGPAAPPLAPRVRVLAVDRGRSRLGRALSILELTAA